jgi:hypothetical protein
MPKVTNTAKAERGFSIFNREWKKGDAPLNASDIESVTIKPGETVEVDEKFLATEGAQALIECGDLEIEGDKPKAKKPKAKKPAKGSGGGDQTGEGKGEGGS